MDTNRRTSAASQSQEVQYDEVDYSRPWRGTPSVPHLHCFNAGRPKRNGWVEPYVGRVSMLSLANVDARAQVMEMDQLQLYRKFDHNLLWDNSILRCGMRFKGKQTNNGSRFHVDVEMQVQCTLCSMCTPLHHVPLVHYTFSTGRVRILERLRCTLFPP